jgi:hypothetical protein
MLTHRHGRFSLECLHCCYLNPGIRYSYAGMTYHEAEMANDRTSKSNRSVQTQDIRIWKVSFGIFVVNVLP